MLYYSWYSPWNSMWINNIITMDMAIEIALRQVPGQIVKVELEEQDGMLVYGVYVASPYGIYEVKINAQNGMVLTVEKEDQ